ncbi:unnamed protein product [Mycena citricolor]|uniref:J domain-containing protein n=1 Tax=Mycena citricolor TaxID=2018698 RepID=A0AAD2HVS1_9AGAR|nr:unnamed protein product [Mycena citricolor]
MAPVEMEYYDLLDVPVDADDNTLKKAYRRQAMKASSSDEKSKAYQVLSDPVSPAVSVVVDVATHSRSKNLRTVYDKNGKSMVDKEGGVNMEDAAGFFANVFGGERFADYIGEISIMKDMTATATTMMTEEEKVEMEKAMNEGSSTPIGEAARSTLSSGSATPVRSTPTTPSASNETSPSSLTVHSEAESPLPPSKESKDKKRSKITPEQKQKLRDQETERQRVMEERVTSLTTKMIERLRPFVEAKHPGEKDDPETKAFEEKMRREAEDLKLESFGVELLHAIGGVYMMKATSFMKSKKFLGIPGFFSRLKEKSDLVKDVFGVIGSALSVRDLMLEMERQQSKGELGEEELRALEMDVTGKIMLASWRGARLEVVQVLRAVVDNVLKDPGVSDLVLLNRAKGLLITGAIFKSTAPDETDAERRELERMVAEAAAPKGKSSAKTAHAKREQMLRQHAAEAEKVKTGQNDI